MAQVSEALQTMTVQTCARNVRFNHLSIQLLTCTPAHAERTLLIYKSCVDASGPP